MTEIPTIPTPPTPPIGVDPAQELASELDAVVQIAQYGWAALLRMRGARLDLAQAAGRPPALGGAAQAEALAQLALPLTAGGACYGMLLLGGGAPTPAQQRLAEALAGGLAQRLRAEHMAEHAQRLARQMALINQLGQHTTSIHDRPQLFAQITSAIYTALGYDHIQLLLADPARGDIALAHASGPFGARLLAQGFREQIGGPGIIGWVAQHGQIWRSDDVQRDARFMSHALLPNTAAEIALPLKLGERVIGVLDVQSDRAHGFDDEDVFLLQTVADQIAPALEHHRLLAAERAERELATTLRDVSRIISSSLDLDQVLDHILQQIGRVVPHHGTRITLRADGDMMRVVAAMGYPDNQLAQQSAFRIADAPLTAPVLFELQTLVVADARTEPRWYWQTGAEQVRSWCCAPLVIKGECIGWLCVDWHEPNFYTQQHARIVRAFADQAAVAIEHARLYATVRQFSDELEQNVQQRTAQLQQAQGQLRALFRRVVRVQEEERQRIAHDLHDGVTQDILGAIYELHALQRRIAAEPAAERLAGCKQLLEQTLQEMKRIIYALRPRALDELGLHAALEHLAGAIRAHHGADVRFQIAGDPAPYPNDVELAIYRIIQEASHNSARHAQASDIRIQLDYTAAGLRVTISDDGRGFVPEYAELGLGIIGMRERAEAHGGTLALRSAPGRGTTIELVLPHHSAPQEDKCPSEY